MHCSGSPRKPNAGCCPHQTHHDLSSNPVLCLKRKAVTLSSSQSTEASGSPACRCLPSGFSIVLHPAQCRGPPLTRSAYVTLEPRQLTHKSSGSTCRSSVSSSSASPPVRLFSHIQQTQTSENGEMETDPVYLSLSFSVSSQPGSAQLGNFLEPQSSNEQPCHCYHCLNLFSAAVGRGHRLNAFINSKPVVLE